MSIKRYFHDCEPGSENYLPLGEHPEGMWVAYDDHAAEVERLQARVREMEATLRQMHEEAKRDEVTQAPTASVYKAYRLAQQRETIEAVAERLGVSLAAARLRAALDALGGTS